MKIIRHPNSTGTLPGTELYTWQQINNATQETQTLVGPLYLSYLEYVLNLDQQNASRQLEQIGTLLTEQAKTWTIGTLPFANVRFYLENNSPCNGISNIIIAKYSGGRTRSSRTQRKKDGSFSCTTGSGMQ